MSDTPRTDALFAQFGPVPHPAVMAYNSLARELERESAKLQEWAALSDDALRLRCGELTAGEIRTIRAVLRAIRRTNSR